MKPVSIFNDYSFVDYRHITQSFKKLNRFPYFRTSQNFKQASVYIVKHQDDKQYFKVDVVEINVS